MITATVDKIANGHYVVADQLTGEVYCYVKVPTDAVDLVREKTGDLDVTVLHSDE